MLSIVSMAHNQSSYTEMLLTSLARPDCGDMPFELVFIDNGSTDETNDLVKSFPLKNNSRFKGLQFISFAENQGVAAAVNAGFEKSRFPLVFQVDNDVVLGPRSLSTMLRWADRHPGALLSPNWPWTQKRLMPTFPRTASKISEAVLRRLQKVGLRAPWIQGAATGSCWMCSKNLFDRVGGWDTGFRNSCASDDFRWKVAVSGAQSHTVPCPVFHFGEVTRKKLSGCTQQEKADLARFESRWGGHPEDLAVLHAHQIRAGQVPAKPTAKPSWLLPFSRGL